APHLPVLAADRDSEEPLLHKPAVASGPTCSEDQEVRGGRNARATIHALTRVSDFPRRFTLENRQLPPASPQSSFSKSRASHVCAEPTLRQNIASRNRKTFSPCAETVDDETSLWKAEEKRGTIARTKVGPRSLIQIFSVAAEDSSMQAWMESMVPLAGPGSSRCHASR